MGAISTPQDYVIFNKFEFEMKPVGVKFLIAKPEGIRKVTKELTLRKMLRDAHSQYFKRALGALRQRLEKQ